MIFAITDFIEKYRQVHHLSGTILVAQAEEIIFHKGYGCADHNCQSACAPETQYRIASITKQFVGAAAMRLYERQAIDLHAPIPTYTDLYPHCASEVTLHQLLNHTSGLPDYHGLPSYCQFKDRKLSSRELVTLFLDLPLVAHPGNVYEYSGVGYALAGLILENISGKSLQDLLRDEFFDPLELKNTRLPHHGSISDLQRQQETSRLASGYRSEVYDFDRTLKVADSRDISTSYAGGGIVSTTSDLLRWTGLLHGGKVLSEEAYKILLRPNLKGYGYGISRHYSKHLDQEVIWHSGGTEGFNSQLLYIPEDQLTICVLLNQENANAVCISRHLAQACLGGRRARVDASRSA